MHVYVSGHPHHAGQGFNLLERGRAHLVSRRRQALRHAALVAEVPVAGTWPALQRWTARLLWALIFVVLYFDMLFSIGAPGLATLMGY